MKKYKNIVFSIVVFLGFLLPHSSVIFLLLHALIPVVLIVFKEKLSDFIPIKILLFLICALVISYFANALFGVSVLELKDTLRLFSFIILFLLFPYVGDVKISNTLLYSLIVIIFLSQLAFVFNVPVLVNVIDRIFPYTGEATGLTTEYLLKSSNNIESIINRRYGGIYRNPNQLSRFVTLLLTVFLIENKKSRTITIIPFLIITFFSISLSGSRTGFVIALLLFLAYFIYIKENAYNIKKAISLLVVSLILFIAYNMVYSSAELRLFKVEEGFDDSVGTKIIWFKQMFDQINSFGLLLFGHFSSANITLLYNVPLLDSEWGELIYSFGLLGVVGLGIFYIKLFSLKDKNIRFFFLILLWGVSSTVIFNFRMSVLFVLFLSKYYTDYKTNEKIKRATNIINLKRKLSE